MHPFASSLVSALLLGAAGVQAAEVEARDNDGAFKAIYIPPRAKLIAHATLASIGFLIFLPIGAIVARYRQVNPFWFKLHYFIQVFAALLIIPGFALGLDYANDGYLPGVDDDDHKKAGIALFTLYIIQLVVGGIIHYVKPKNSQGRPPQNYFHAVLGIAIIGLAFYQVRQGYREEWPVWTFEKVPSGVQPTWIVWLVVIAVLYLAGLALLPQQLKKEKENRAPRDTKGAAMAQA